MSRFRKRYPLEFRHQLLALVRAGGDLKELSREFEPRAETIQAWVAQADLDAGNRTDGLTSAESEEFRKLRREHRRLRMEREILSKAAAWFA